MTTYKTYSQAALCSPWLLILAAALSFWLGLGWVPLFDLDEGAFTEATREMLESGIFSATYLDGEPRYDKPIFFYWLQALSIRLFGFNEWAFRAPSALAACLWAWAIYRFSKEQWDSQRAHIATLFVISCLWVALIARSAIADALLNLFITLTFFDIWRYIRTQKRLYAIRLYLWMALGTLTKGPIAVAAPLLVSLLYFISRRELREYYLAYFELRGWALYFAVVSPWLIAVYLEQGSGFFEGFIIEHNLKRFSATRESHGGSIFYYVIALPIILLPVSGLLFPVFKQVKRVWQGDISRFLLLWFSVYFCLFSFSKTQLPHYILNGCIPLILLIATNTKLAESYRWTSFINIIVAGILLALPELLRFAAEHSSGYDGANLALYQQALPPYYRLLALATFIIILFISLRPGLQTWQRLGLSGLVINCFIFTQFVSVASGVQQAPIHQTIRYLETHYPEQAVKRYRMQMPSFSVYRQQPTLALKEAPRSATLVLLRIDRLNRLIKDVAPAEVNTLFRSGGLILVRVQGHNRD